MSCVRRTVSADYWGVLKKWNPAPYCHGPVLADNVLN